jgi:hypothetical protein
VNRGEAAAVRSTAGILRQLTPRELVLESDDHRLLFYRLGDHVEMPEKRLAEGDRLIVTHVADDQGVYTATVVQWSEAGSAEDRERAAEPLDAPPPRPALDPPEKEDNAITRARAAAEEFLEALPSFQVRRNTTRYVQEQARGPWRAVDVVTATLVYRQGREDYTDVRIGGKPVQQPLNDIAGLRSTGEFGETLRELLDADTGTRFGAGSVTQLRGRRAWKYRYEVPQERSEWRIEAPSEHYYAGYAGAVWIDQETARVLRIEIEARGLPREFPFDTVEMNVDYDFVRLEGRAFLLPTEAEALNCIRGASVCMRNATSFRNYIKFHAESGIRFEDIP